MKVTRKAFIDMASFRAAALLAVASIASGRFADTAGEERLTKHIGPIYSLSNGNSRHAIVSTTADVLAAVNVRTGEPSWRVPFSDGAYIDEAG